MGIKIGIPKAFKRIKEPHRFKIFYGGRGAGKSETVARYLLLCGYERPMTILCAREFQTSIKDSVHQLLSDLIEHYKLDEFYTVRNTEIEGMNGTLFTFAGIRHNIGNIKSMHNVQKCWVEEAETVTENSWKVLTPTIRAKDSEIIATFNPDIPDSPTYQRFVVHPPPDALVMKVNYDQNPHFPDVLRKEMEHMKETDFEEYLHVWEGNCRAAVPGAIFAKQIQKAEEEGRITKVPYDPSVPVCTYWDLGKSALTAIWFCQYVGLQWRVLRHYSNHLQEIDHYIKYIQDLPYVYDTHYLPHDAEQKKLGMPHTITEQIAKALHKVNVVPRVQLKADSINSAQQIFSQCWFDAENCDQGISDLRRYAYRISPETGKISNEPEEGTTYRDTADAFQCFAMARKQPKKEPDPWDKMMAQHHRIRGSRKQPNSNAWWKAA